MCLNQLIQLRQGADVLGHFKQFFVDDASLRLAIGHEAVEELARVGAQDQLQQPMQQVMQRGVRDGDGNVRLEILCALAVHAQHEIPHTLHILLIKRFSQELADLDQVVVQFTQPDHRQLLHPAKLLAQARNDGLQLLKGRDHEWRTTQVKINRVLVTVNVMIVPAKPFSVERRKTHQSE